MHTSTTIALAAALFFSSAAQAETIEVGQPLARFAALKAGTHHYLIYSKKDGANIPLSIWEREVIYTADGMRIRQRWDGTAPGMVKTLDSWFDKATFKPRSHVRITEKDGKRVVEGFVFDGAKVTGMKDLADNTQKELAVTSDGPTYNFETDMEFLGTLPLAEGYEAKIRFYHPGGPAPAWYTWKVIGSETIPGPRGPVDCWVLQTDYNKPGQETKFWYAKDSQILVHLEGKAPNGSVFVKALID
ncbi:hypothetical protein E4L96_00645 [Massilia arenosa]|uniref:DUF3108 domain-containing protein n=1 Tax=Zemynaea arenosa TaxID=2561931 RepID=A0A4Y9SUA3_9BURK|nr:DUF3108 domain-containing protein [Massilia arenosa]TFW30035.1 hypothetical protein E4L96_00645 [Massilia arenosa]